MLAVERYFFRPYRPRAGREHYDRGLQFLAFPSVLFDEERRRVHEGRVAVDDLYVIAGKLIYHDFHLVFRDLGFSVHEFLKRHVSRKHGMEAVRSLLFKVSERKRGLAERLARKGSGVKPGSAYEGFSFDYRDRLSELGGLHRRLLPARPRANHKHVVTLQLKILPSDIIIAGIRQG